MKNSLMAAFIFATILLTSACGVKIDQYTPKAEPSTSVTTTSGSANKYAHVSIDDVIGILEDVDNEKLESVWDQKELKYLKHLHDEYGVVVTLEVFARSDNGDWGISDMTDKYKAEFSAASDWLRFGFHSGSSSSKYGVDNGPDEALNDYKTVVESIARFAGETSIDNMPRIHYFAASKDCIDAWKHSNAGITGLLSADDDRLPYALNKEQASLLVKRDKAAFDGIEYYRTDLRFENTPNAVEELKKRTSDPQYEDQMGVLIAFTHEVQLKERSIRNSLEDTCEWISANGYKFAFPEDLAITN